MSGEFLKMDIFQCEIEFLTMGNWIYFNVKLDFFQYEIGFLPMFVFNLLHQVIQKYKMGLTNSNLNPAGLFLKILSCFHSID